MLSARVETFTQGVSPPFFSLYISFLFSLPAIGFLLISNKKSFQLLNKDPSTEPKEKQDCKKGKSEDSSWTVE